MNARNTTPSIPASLAIPLAILATFAPTATARLLLSLVVVTDGGTPVIVARLAQGLYLALVPEPAELATLSHALTSRGYTLSSPADRTRWRRLADVMLCGGAGDALDADALAVFLDSLPALATHVTLGPTSRYAIDAAHLRTAVTPVAMLAPRSRLAASRVVYAEERNNASGMLLAGERWRVLLRSTNIDREEAPRAHAFDPLRPIALACATCGHVAPLRHADEESAQTEALRRRWTRHDTDEGETYACRPCSARSAKENAR